MPPGSKIELDGAEHLERPGLVVYSVEDERGTERPVRGQRRRVRHLERDVAQAFSARERATAMASASRS